MNGAYAVAPTRPSTLDDGMKSEPLASAWAGVPNHPTSRTEEPAVRFQAVVRLTGVKSLAFESSVMFARVATDAFGLTDSVAALVAVRATVATLDVRPTWARAFLSPESEVVQ